MTMNMSIPYNPNEIDDAIDRRLALKGNGAVWHNPSTNLMVHDTTGHSRPPQVWDMPVIADYAEHLRIMERTKGASSGTIQDMLDFGHISPEYQDLYVQMYDTWARLAKEGKTKSAGVITMKDYAVIANQIVSQETLDLTVRDFALEGSASTTKTATTIEVALPDRITGTLWSTKPGEFDISDTVNISYAAATTTLEKAQVHVASSVWVNMVERRHDVVADTLRQARAEEPRIMEDAIAGILGGFADTAAGEAWDVIAGGAFHHTTNPLTLFFTNTNTIYGAGGSPNVLVMSPKTFQVLISNTWMSTAGPLQYGQPVGETNVTGRTATHPKLPGYSIVISRKITDGLIFQYDKATVWSITGPQRTGTYEKNPGYIEGTILDRWYGAAIVEATLGKEITGTTS